MRGGHVWCAACVACAACTACAACWGVGGVGGGGGPVSGLIYIDRSQCSACRCVAMPLSHGVRFRRHCSGGRRQAQLARTPARRSARCRHPPPARHRPPLRLSCRPPPARRRPPPLHLWHRPPPDHRRRQRSKTRRCEGRTRRFVSRSYTICGRCSDRSRAADVKCSGRESEMPGGERDSHFFGRPVTDRSPTETERPAVRLRSGSSG